MNNKKLLLLAALAAAWYFFIRKDPATGKPTGLPFLTPRPTTGNNVVALPKPNATNPAQQRQQLLGINGAGGTGGGNGIDVVPLVGAGVKAIGYGVTKFVDWLFSPSPTAPSQVFQTTGPAPTGTGYNVYTNQSTAPVEVEEEPAGTVNNPFTNQSTNWGTVPIMLPRPTRVGSGSFGKRDIIKAATLPRLPNQVGGVRGENHDRAIARQLTRRLHGV